ncbi:beta-mannosidase [Sediminihabitans luteus]|nr:beta-mannosidase [Sediminihabitans luteus]
MTVPATVPGTVHTDLHAAGLIPDPYLDDNERLLAWIGSCDWEYRTTFDWSACGHDHHDLVLEGLDTVATVLLNGAVVARTANQHRSYRVPVAGRLVDGTNELVVRFASPVRYADAQSLALGYRPQVNHHPFNAMRKSACNFGWDWGIDAATVGIWRPVSLHSWSTARIAGVRPLASVTLSDDAAGPGSPATSAPGRVEVHVEVERAEPASTVGTAAEPLVVDVSLVGPAGSGPGSRTASATLAPDESSVVVVVDVPDAALWWPRGYGDQPLSDVTVGLRAAATSSDTGTDSHAGTDAATGASLATWAGRVGFRQVALEIEPDEHGTSFRFVVNGRPVFVKGANWIPDDVFPHRVTRERYAARIAQAEQAGINLLRVWGGGIYEDDDFYDLCDERGLMTWQDFLFACAAYAEEEPLASEVEAEAREHVARLAAHPCLVLWNGNNENLWGHQDWGWEARLDGRTWGLGYYTELLPGIVAELDPDRPYTPGSPWSGTFDRHPNDPDHGSVHLWEQWNRRDWPTYREVVPRFCAEFGWQAPPAWTTLTRAVSDDPLTPESPGMQVHQKAAQGNDKLTDGLVPHLRLPQDMPGWHWAMQLNQAVAVQAAVEHLRSWSPRCAGSIMWQLNDCWPVVSWSAVDGDGRAKPLLHALAHAHADRLVTFQPRSRDGGPVVPGGPTRLEVVVVNDTSAPWSGDLVLRRLGFDGSELASARVLVAVEDRGVVSVPVPHDVAAVGDPGAELLVAELDGVRGLWFVAEPRDSALAAADLDVEVTPDTSASGPSSGADVTLAVTVTARNLVRDVSLLVDRAHPDATVDDMLVTLLPGESVTFRVTAPGDVDPAAFTDPLVLRSTNDLCGP